MAKSNPPAVSASRLQTWFSREHWIERIVSFNASWFTVSMSTGIIVQILTNFPYPAQWIRNLAYCFWILTIVLFLFFSTLGIVRCIGYPRLTRALLQDFYQTSYLGAIPVTLDTIIAGIIIFYSIHPAAVWAAFGLYWISVALTLFVGGIIVFITTAYQEAPELSSINGVWLLSFIPMVVTSTTGATLVSYLQISVQGFTIIVTFLIWSVGLCMTMLITVIYFWRLMRHKLPVREAIVSCFIPVGPPAMSAYGIHKLAIAMSTYISARNFSLVLEDSDPALQSSGQVSASIHWIGVLISLFLVAFATFWLLHGTLSVFSRIPKKFNVGFWGFVFPNGVYVNALSLLAKDLNNHGLRGWAATMCVVTVLLWCFCAAGTLWKGVWLGELFFPPGLEGWNERKALGMDNEQNGSDSSNGKLKNGVMGHAHESEPSPNRDGENSDVSRIASNVSDSELLGEDILVTTERASRADGTYEMFKSRRRRMGQRSWSMN